MSFLSSGERVSKGLLWVPRSNLRRIGEQPKGCKGPGPEDNRLPFRLQAGTLRLHQPSPVARRPLNFTVKKIMISVHKNSL